MNKYLLVGASAILLVGGGWWYFNQSVSPAPEPGELPSLQEIARQPATGQLVPITSVRVGDTMGEFTITSINPSTMKYADPQKDFTISFSGQTTITGTAEIGGFWGADSVGIAVDKADNPQLPRFMFKENKNTRLMVCISNPDAARQVLTANPGAVSVTVKNYVVRFETDTAFCDSAEFVGLAQLGQQEQVDTPPSATQERLSPSLETKQYSNSEYGISFTHPSNWNCGTGKVSLSHPEWFQTGCNDDDTGDPFVAISVPFIPEDKDTWKKIRESTVVGQNSSVVTKTVYSSLASQGQIGLVEYIFEGSANMKSYSLFALYGVRKPYPSAEEAERVLDGVVQSLILQ